MDLSVSWTGLGFGIAWLAACVIKSVKESMSCSLESEEEVGSMLAVR